MILLYDRELTISCAGTCRSKQWPSARMMWSEMVDRLEHPIRGSESYDAYLRMPKRQQDTLKDVGGFVGGALRNGLRKNGCVIGRDLIALDLDAIAKGQTDAVLDAVRALGVAYAVYSTRKHSPDKPRLRVVLPLDRTVSAEEYEPISRKVAEKLGIERCDPTTFQPVRMMYWPSVCADGEYVFRNGDNDFISADAVLSEYSDWHDVRQWPRVPGEIARTQTKAATAEDPAEKTGLVGAWCKLHDIYSVLEDVIPGVYTPCEGSEWDGAAGGQSERWTYCGGSTTGGAIIYGGGKWLFSHHGTDPASGILCNAWDLVRIHKFGDLDADAAPDTPGHRLPSYTAMKEFASSLPEVSRAMLVDRLSTARADFFDDADVTISDPVGPTETYDDDDISVAEGAIATRNGKSWIDVLSDGGKLTLAGRDIEATSDNIKVLLTHDPLLAGRIAYDRFAAQLKVKGDLPWWRDPDPESGNNVGRVWSDADDAGLRWYLEKAYGIVSRQKIDDALLMLSQITSYDDVEEYLSGLTWDGKPRVETLLCKYLKADDTPYVRAVTRKTLVAAVERTFHPGAKFDTVLTLAGGQGIGKSLLADILGGKWYTDSIQTFEGKEAAEQLRNAWIAEIPEVDRFSTKEAAIAKQFITRRDDIFREAYGRRTGSHPRRCIFVATVNPDAFLTDDTGNRRWWVVRCRATAQSLGVPLEELRRERDQVWAEAVHMWRNGETLTLDTDLARTAVAEQEDARIEDPWESLIEAFVARKVPTDWNGRDTAERLTWLADDFAQVKEGVELVDRDRICAIEIWCEALRYDPGKADKWQIMRINKALKRLEGWEQTRQRCGPYGQQRCFKRVEDISI